MMITMILGMAFILRLNRISNSDYFISNFPRSSFFFFLALCEFSLSPFLCFFRSRSHDFFSNFLVEFDRLLFPFENVLSPPPPSVSSNLIQVSKYNFLNFVPPCRARCSCEKLKVARSKEFTAVDSFHH